MGIAKDIAKKIVHDKISSQVKIAQARLETLKAKAEAMKANAELKVITDLLTRKHAIDQDLDKLKESGESKWEQSKSIVESRVAELETSVRTLESKLTTA
jgi:hypothetical protein